MLQFRSQIALALFALCGTVSPALAVELPVPDAYPGTEALFAVDEQSSFFEVALGPIVRRAQPISMSSHKMSGLRGYYGSVARRHYKLVADDASTSEVHDHYAEWFTANGFSTLLDARGDSPMAPGGTSWALRAYGDLPTEVVVELSGTSDKSRRRYMVAEKRDNGEHTVITVLVNPRRSSEVRLQVDVLAVDADKTGNAFPTRAQLYERLMTTGHVHVGGIQYVGKTTVPRDSCDAALADVAAMLAEHGELRLAVVGRVTIEGNEEMAINLALARADAVTTMLILEHGVAPIHVEARAAEQETDGDAVPDESGNAGAAAVIPPPPDGIEFVVRR